MSSARTVVWFVLKVLVESSLHSLTSVAVKIKANQDVKFRMPVFNWAAPEAKPDWAGTVFNEIDDERLWRYLFSLVRNQDLLCSKARMGAVLTEHFKS